MRAIIFSRVSTQRQTLEQQTEKLVQEAMKRGYDDSSIIIIQEKESGSKLLLNERIGLQKLRDELDKYDDIDCIFIYELSRLSRRPADLYQIRDYLLQKHVNLISLTPYMELLDENGNFNSMASVIFGIYSSLSEQEGYLRIERVMRGKERKKAEGKLSVGKPFFGYALDQDHRPIPHHTESKAVIDIFDRYVNKRESSGAIAHELFLKNAFRDKGYKEITIQNYVCTILRDKRYAGLVESIYPPIITKELWLKAEAIRKVTGCKFTRKSKTKQIYPLQGYLFTIDGHQLTIGVTNNRYVKMNDAAVTRIGINMTAAHGIAKIAIKRHVEKMGNFLDVEQERKELTTKINVSREKLSNIDNKITALQEENERINSRIIKGRLSESKGDEMIDANVMQMHSLEDDRAGFDYDIAQAEQRLAILANPLLSIGDDDVDMSTDQKLREGVEKYIKKIVVQKVKFSTYKLDFYFLDSYIETYHFYSINRGIVYYDKDMNQI